MKLNNIIIICFFVTFNWINAQEASFNFFVGPSIPSKEVSEYFPNRLIETNDSINKNLMANYQNVEIGYHISIRGNINLSDNAYFYGSFGIHKFKVSELQLLSVSNLEQIGSMDVQTTIYPISAGINYYLYDGLFRIYLNGGLDYNYQVNLLDNIESKYILKLSQETTFSSLGFTFGPGFEIPLGKASLVIEANYSNLKFIGQSTNENSKSIKTLRLGLKF